MHFNPILYFGNINKKYFVLADIAKNGISNYKIRDNEFFHPLDSKITLKNGEERRTTFDDHFEKTNGDDF